MKISIKFQTHEAFGVWEDSFFYLFIYLFIYFAFWFPLQNTVVEDFSRNISMKVLLKYLHSLCSKSYFSILPTISVWKLQTAIATKL